MNRRTPNDTCFLCQKNEARKKKSHIISKFFANSFLTSGKGSKLTNKGSKKNVIQDSPKENYIFCSNCESFLEAIETEISPYYNNYHNLKLSKRLKSNALKRLIIKRDPTLNAKLFHLFNYSLLFRASISTHEVFRCFKLTDKTEQTLRVELMKFHSLTKTDFLNKMELTNFDLKIKYIMCTCVNFPGDSFCGIMANSSLEVQMLVANKFAYFLNTNNTQYFEKNNWNAKTKDKNIVLLKFETWKTLFIDLHFSLMSGTNE